MAKFVMECPNCGKYAEARKGIFGLFGTRKLKCTCGYTIDVKTGRLSSRVCRHCGNTVVFDQKKGDKALCPVCHEPINTLDDISKVVEFSCEECGITLLADKDAATYTCPVCDHVNDVQARKALAEIQKSGVPSRILFEGDADTLVWKHPVEDFNKGSQMVVRDSQEVIFFVNGMALTPFTAGRYTLESKGLPPAEDYVYLMPDSGDVIHSQVYFVNMASQMAVKWGTPDRVNIIDPLTGAPFSIGVRGVLNFRISDSRKFVLKLVGTTGGLKREDVMDNGNNHIRNYFREVIQVVAPSCIASAITNESIDILQIDLSRARLSKAVLPELKPYFDDYGIEITELMIAGIELPEKGDLGYDALQTIIGLRQSNLKKAVIDNETDLTLAAMDAKKAVEIKSQQMAAEIERSKADYLAAKGENEVLGTLYKGKVQVEEAKSETEAERLRLQLEMERKLQTAQIEAEEMRLKGYTQKDVINAEVQKAYAEGIGQAGSRVNVDSALPEGLMKMGVRFAEIGFEGSGLSEKGVLSPDHDSWTCRNCGKTGITSKFCPDCGTPKPSEDNGWTCRNCGRTGITSKFCPDCGTPKD